MILLTGYKGFIGSHFLKYLENEAERDVIGIDMDNAWDFMAKFNGWENVDLIIHNGAISYYRKKLDEDLPLQPNIYCSSLCSCDRTQDSY